MRAPQLPVCPSCKVRAAASASCAHVRASRQLPAPAERDPYFIGQLIPVLKPILFSTNENVVSRGSVASELFIITSGTLHVFIPYQWPVAAGEAIDRGDIGGRRSSIFAGWSGPKPLQAILSGKSTMGRFSGGSHSGGRRGGNLTPTHGHSEGGGVAEGAQGRRSLQPWHVQGGQSVSGPRQALGRLFHRRHRPPPVTTTSSSSHEPEFADATGPWRVGSLSEGDMEEEVGVEAGEARDVGDAVGRPRTSSGDGDQGAHPAAQPPRPRAGELDSVPAAQPAAAHLIDTGRIRGPPSGAHGRIEWRGRRVEPGRAADRRNSSGSSSGTGATASGSAGNSGGAARSDGEGRMQGTGAGAGGHGLAVEATAGIDIVRSAPTEMANPTPTGRSPASQGNAPEERGGGNLVAPGDPGRAESRSQGWVRFVGAEHPERGDSRFLSNSSGSVPPSKGSSSSSSRMFYSGEQGAGEGDEGHGNGDTAVRGHPEGFATVEEVGSEASKGSRQQPSPSPSAAELAANEGAAARVAATAADAGAVGDPGLVPGTEEWATSADADVQEVQHRVARERAATEALGAQDEVKGAESSGDEEESEAFVGRRDEELHIASVRRGAVVGEMALLVPHQRGRRCASLRAACPSEVLGVDYSDLQPLLMSFRDVLDDLLDSAYERNKAMEHARRTIRGLRQSSGPEAAGEALERKHSGEGREEKQPE